MSLAKLRGERHQVVVLLRRSIPLIAILASAIFAMGKDEPHPRAPVHPRRNVEEFATVDVKFVRFTILRTNRGEPCLDEWEIYGPNEPAINLALADTGTRVSASGTLPDYRIHALRHVNDGVYGNAHSWICDQPSGWVQLEFPEPLPINRMIWSRDRLGKFTDRLATDYRIEVALQPGAWQTMASSAGRPALDTPDISVANPFTESVIANSAEPAIPTGPAGKEYVLETWRNAQGLPGNRVTAIVQTPDRWLWVGTVNGLARFDGLRFRSFAERDGLPAPHVTHLYVDRRGVLWVATDAGLAFWEDDRFHAVTLGEIGSLEPIVALTQDENGVLWAGTRGGLYAMENETFRQKRAGPISSLASDPASEGFWFIQGSRLQRWNHGKAEVLSEGEEPSRFGSLRTLAIGKQGDLWFGGANEYLGRYANENVSTFAEGHAVFTTVIQQILPGANGDVWMGSTGSGLARMRNGTVLSFGAEDGLFSNHIVAICEDHEDNIWVGGNDGLTRISPRRCTAINVADGLSHSVITSLAENPPGTLWIGTNGGGLNRWSGGSAEPFSPSYVLDNEVISALCVEDDGALSVATGRAGLARIKDGKLSFYSGPDIPSQIAASALAKDGNGRLWLGLRNGAAILSNNGAAFDSIEQLSGAHVTAIAFGESGEAWIGTANRGLAVFDGTAWKRWTSANGLAGDAIRAIYLGDNHNTWVATNAGISRIQSGRIDNFGAAEGLPSGTISQILTDRSGNLWLGTNHGIARVGIAGIKALLHGRAARLDVLMLDRSDGLPNLECTTGFQESALRLHDGRLAFGTVGGLVLLDPAQFESTKAPPTMIIESIAFRGEPPRPTTAFPHEPTGGARATFQFTALSYTAPQRTRLRYRLDGLQTDWTESGLDRTATYEYIPPGAYRFVAQASHDGTQWSESSFAFHVPAPWWKTLPALAAATVLGAGLIAGGVRFMTRRRMQRRLHEVEQKLAVERERTRIARDIHDQLGANLTHIALLSLPGTEVRDESARERLRAIASTSNELIQSVDAIVWAVSPRHGTLESLARYLSRFAADFLAPSGVRLRLDVPLDLPDVQLSPELRHNVYLACREALNNAVKHARATEINLAMRVADDVFTIELTDNGYGFIESDTPAGEGLESMRRRLQENGGTCEIASAPGKGTKVAFTIPLRAT